MALAVLMLCAGGCAARGNVELLESQLRQQEDRLRSLNQQLSQTESDLHIAQREVETLRIQLAERGEQILLPEQAQALFHVAGIRVQKLLTGGLDRDGEPGDDLLNVVIVPHDEQGEAVKLPGDLEIEVLDLTAPEHLRKLGVWRFSAEQVADHWQSGLTSGFQFRMPWQLPPVSDDIVVHARFQTADGRKFGTSAEVRVTPARKAIARMKERNKSEPTPEITPLAPPVPNYVDQVGGTTPMPPAPAEPAKFSLKPTDHANEKPGGDFYPVMKRTAPIPKPEEEPFQMPEIKTPAESETKSIESEGSAESDFALPMIRSREVPDPPRPLVSTSLKKTKPESSATQPAEPMPQAGNVRPKTGELPTRYRRTDR